MAACKLLKVRKCRPFFLARFEKTKSLHVAFVVIANKMAGW